MKKSTFFVTLHVVIKIRRLKRKDEKEVVKVLSETFIPFYENGKHHIPQKVKRSFKEANMNLSLGAFDGEKLVAVYLFRANNEFHSPIKGRGVEGVALGVLPKYQKQKIADQFISQVLKMNFDYWWGASNLVLKKKKFWQKYRDIYLETDTTFYSIRELS